LVPLKRPGGGTTVAALSANPHLARTRPPARPPAQPPQVQLEADAEDDDAADDAADAARDLPSPLAPVPLAKQRRRQVAAAPAPRNTLMLDPVFGDSAANISGDVRKESDTSTLAQVSAHSLGAEQFRHDTSILGHRINVISHRVAPGRVAASGAHAVTASYSNVEASVLSMIEERKARGRAK